jgi:predicted  nucleic acid-binding Zn-ribbon protein
VENSQIELMVHLQDIDLMIHESEHVVKTLGFTVEGLDKLLAAREELAKQLTPRYLNTYKRLAKRYNRPIVPVQDDTCLGCFAKLPTSFSGSGRDEKKLMTCENCGRILYWLE